MIDYLWLKESVYIDPFNISSIDS